MQKVFLLNLNEYLRNWQISGGYQMIYSDIGMHRNKCTWKLMLGTPPPTRLDENLYRCKYVPRVILYAHTGTRNCERGGCLRTYNVRLN